MKLPLSKTAIFGVLLCAVAVAGCGGDCSVGVERGQNVRNLQLAPVQVGIPTGWKSVYSADVGSESLGVSDPTRQISLHILVFPADAEGVFVSAYKPVGPATVALSNGVDIAADKVTAADGTGYRVTMRVEEMIVEIATTSGSDQCDAQLHDLFMLVTPPGA